MNEEATKLYFCYRWMLTYFKREYEFEEAKRVFEVMWSHHLHDNFNIFFAVAMLTSQRARILNESMQFDMILQMINQSPKTFNLEEMLCTAEAIFLKFETSADDERKKALFPTAQPMDK